MGLGAARDLWIRGILEETPGTTPAGNMQAHIFSTFDTGTADISRTPTGGAERTGETSDNPADGFNAALSASYPLTYGRGLSREILAQVCGGLPATATAVTDTVSFVNAGNKIVRGTASAGWPFTPGDIVAVAGGGANPAWFVAPVAAVAGDEMTLDWITLQDEASVADVKVYHSGRQGLAGGFLTAAWEAWHDKMSTGETRNYVSFRQYQEGFSDSKAVTVSVSAEAARLPEEIQSQLGNGTTAAAPQQQYTAVHHFQGGGTAPAAGLGFRVNGALQDELEIKDLSWSIERPRLTDMGAGKGLRKHMTIDGSYVVKVTMKCFGGSAPPDNQLHALLRNGKKPETVDSLAWGYIDGAGRARLNVFPALQPTKASRTGVNETGPYEANFEWLAKVDPAGLLSMANVFYFDAA